LTRWTAPLLAVCLAATSARADSIRSRQEDLQKVRREISRKSRERREADLKARELEREVERISRELKSSQRSLKEVEKRIRDTERRRSDAENRLWAARLDVKQWNRAVTAEMRRLYERKLAAESARFVELAWRRRLVRDKIAAMSDAVARHAEIKESHEELVTLEKEFEGLREERSKEAEKVREARSRMTGLLATVQGRKAVLENDLQELKVSAKRFETLISDLIREREAKQKSAALAASERERTRTVRKTARGRRHPSPPPDFGKLPWPVEGAVVGRFGKFKHPELDTVVVSNGITIRPAEPSPVRAVAKGEVLYAGEFMGYGLMALLVHPDNLFTIYARLGELNVKKGQKVSVGEILGTSGTDAEDKPAVYFELRLHGEAMDPLVWLK
jgi:septal ring factor EnvC (AmiA/AmiB activator)